MLRLLSSLFSCRHKRIGSVRTNPKTRLSHVQCFDCGRNVEYDWDTMQIGRVLEDQTRPVTWQDMCAETMEDK